MRYAIVKDGVVTNVTIVDGDIPDFLSADGDLIPDENEQAGPGMLCDGTNFTAPEEKQHAAGSNNI